MAKIRYTIRLYRLHDLDLITFVETHEFNIITAIYSSLKAFTNNEVFVIEIPPRREAQLPKLNRVYTKALILDSEEDKDTIELLNKVGKGYRNNFLKNLLRLYLCNPLSEEFFRVVIKRDSNTNEPLLSTSQEEIDANTILFEEKFKVFKDGKKIVKAGKLKKNNIRKKTEKIENNPKTESQPKSIEKEIEKGKEEETIVKVESSKEDRNNILNNETVNEPINNQNNINTNNTMISDDEADEITEIFGRLEG